MQQHSTLSIAELGGGGDGPSGPAGPQGPPGTPGPGAALRLFRYRKTIEEVAYTHQNPSVPRILGRRANKNTPTRR